MIEPFIFLKVIAFVLGYRKDLVVKVNYLLVVDEQPLNLVKVNYLLVVDVQPLNLVKVNYLLVVDEQPLNLAQDKEW